MFAMHLSNTKFNLLYCCSNSSSKGEVKVEAVFKAFILHRKYLNHKFLDFGFALTARSWIVRSFVDDEFVVDTKNWMYLSQTSSTYGFWSTFSSNIKSWSVISLSIFIRDDTIKLCFDELVTFLIDVFLCSEKEEFGKRQYVFFAKNLCKTTFKHGRCKTKKEEEKRGARLAGKCNRQATLAEAEQARFLSPPEKFG